jgi:hypothetical protein
MRHYLGVLAALAMFGLYMGSRLLIFVSALGIMFIVVLGRVKVEDEQVNQPGSLGSWGASAGLRTRQPNDAEQVTRSFRGRDGSLTVVTETVMDGGASFGFGADTPLIPEPVPTTGFVCRGRVRELVLLPDRLVVRPIAGERQESIRYDQVRGVTFTRLHGSAGAHPAAALFAPMFRVGGQPAGEHGDGGVLRIDLAGTGGSEISLHSLASGEQHDPLAIAFEAGDAELFRQASSWLLQRSAGSSLRRFA